MSHPFGDLLTQYLHRKHGLSQIKLAAGILQSPSIITEMCHGKRLTGPQARQRIIAILRWLQLQGALNTLAEANALLTAASMSPLDKRDFATAAFVPELHGQVDSEPLQAQRESTNTHDASASMLHVSFSTPHHNLPVQLTPFIGRTQQISQLVQQVQTLRLLTLTGAGGVGKTRLALEVAAGVLNSFQDGAWFVDLASLTDPALLPQRVLDIFQVPEHPNRSPIRMLTTYLAAKHLVLILDNCEHLVDACAELAEQILRTCPQVHLLATSREALLISAETPWRVPSLTHPPLKSVIHYHTPQGVSRTSVDDDLGPKPQDIEQYDAMRFFIDRVRTLQPAFALDADNVNAIAQICSHLDGIPLALEMAAARVNTFTIEEIAERLSGAFDARFQLLTAGMRTAPPRHRTLRATLDWSYDLLTPAEQCLLARLSVFAGSWTAEAAEAVAGGNWREASCDEKDSSVDSYFSPASMLDLLAQLVGKSLVIADQQAGQTRYRLQQTVRQFAHEKLAGLGEMSPLCERHLVYFLTLAEEPPVEMLAGPSLSQKMRQLHTERDNLRSALDWAHGQADHGELALRLAGALWFYWYNHGYRREGIVRLQAALEQGRNAAALARGRATVAMAHFMWGVDTDYMITLAEEGLHLCRQGENAFGVAYALVLLAEAARRHCDYERSQELFDESLHMALVSGSPEAIWNAVSVNGQMLVDQGKSASAAVLLEQSVVLARQWVDPRYMLWPLRFLSIVNHPCAMEFGDAEVARQREIKDPEGLAVILHALGNLLLDAGHFTPARAALNESLVLWQNLGFRWHWVGGTGRVLFDLGRAAWLQGDHAAATAHYEESVQQFRDVCDNEFIALAQAHRGYAALSQDVPADAAVYFQESLCLLEVTGGLAGLKYVPIVIAGLAEVAYLQGHQLEAALLFGAAQTSGALLPNTVPPSERIGYARLMDTACTRFTDPASSVAWAAGQAMLTLDEVIAHALKLVANLVKAC